MRLDATVLPLVLSYIPEKNRGNAQAVSRDWSSAVFKLSASDQRPYPLSTSPFLALEESNHPIYDPQLPVHMHRVTQILTDHPSKTIVSADLNTVRISTSQRRYFTTLPGPIYSISWHPEFPYVWVAHKDGLTEIDCESLKSRVSAVYANGVMHTAGILDKNRILHVYSQDDVLVFRTDAEHWSIPVGKVKRVLLSQECTYALLVRGKKNIEIWDIKQRRQLIDHSCVKRLTAWAFSSDEHLAATGDKNGAIKLWDLRAKRSIRDLNADHKKVCSLQFTDKGQTLVGLNPTGHIHLWSMPTGTWIESIPLLPDYTPFSAIGFSPENGRHFFAGSNSGVVNAICRQSPEELVFNIANKTLNIEALPDHLSSAYSKGLTASGKKYGLATTPKEHALTFSFQNTVRAFEQHLNTKGPKAATQYLEGRIKQMSAGYPPGPLQEMIIGLTLTQLSYDCCKEMAL